jgi:hypothetical protein
VRLDGASGVTMTSTGVGAGRYNFDNRQPVNFAKIERNALNVNGGAHTFNSDLGAGFPGVALDVNNANVVFASTQQLGALRLGPGGHVTLTAGGNKVLATSDLQIAAAAEDAWLDLADNDLVVNYAAGAPSPLGDFDGTSYNGIQGMIAQAYNHNAWDGRGLRSSMTDARDGLTTLAPAEAAGTLFLGATQTALWNGVTVDGTTVLVKYTYAGDANLDGVIDGGDYGVIDNFVQVPGASAYFNGDFNYDGVIDGGDYGIIDNNIQAQGAQL